jgi:hypothetical protein
MMRIRIVRQPPARSVDGILLDTFEPSHQYEVGNSLGSLMLAEGWAEPVPLDEPTPLPPFGERDVLKRPERHDPDTPPNLTRETYQTFLDRLPFDIAADSPPRRRKP